MTILRGTYTTKKGNDLHYRMSYNKGGANPFNGKIERRGYRLFIQRDPKTWAAHSSLNDEKGAARLFLHEVKRQSQKQADIAADMVTEELLQSIADRHGI